METSSARLVGTTGAHRAPMPTPSAADVRIDGWLVQPSLNLLERDEVTVRLRSQLMDLLLCLASQPGKVFGKDELMAVVWEGRWVAQSAFSRCIAELRAALGDDAHRPRIIETIPKRGYRLIAPVAPVSRASRGASVAHWLESSPPPDSRRMTAPVPRITRKLRR